MPNAHLLQAALEGLQAQKERIEEQIREVQSMLGGRSGPRAVAAAEAGKAGATPTRKRRPLSEAARKRIAAAQKRRWAAFRKEQKAAE
jgi:dihydrodipicolinate synthase/N-acetylneuraminate lyase